MPPPLPVTVLAENVQPPTVRVASCWLKTPPPIPAELPERVERARVIVPALETPPPPWWSVDELPENVQRVRFARPRLRTPPPKKNAALPVNAHWSAVI